MNKTFTIKEIKALYHQFEEYRKEWSDGLDHEIRGVDPTMVKPLLGFTEWLDVYEQGNDELIYY